MKLGSMAFIGKLVSFADFFGGGDCGNFSFSEGSNRTNWQRIQPSNQHRFHSPQEENRAPRDGHRPGKDSWGDTSFPEPPIKIGSSNHG